MKKKLSLGEKIRTARTTAKLSQKELGDKLRLTDKAVSAYEVGRAQPSVDILRDIGTATGHPMTYFVEDDHVEEIDLTMRIKSIEKELEEIKRELREKGYSL